MQHFFEGSFGEGFVIDVGVNFAVANGFIDFRAEDLRDRLAAFPAPRSPRLQLPMMEPPPIGINTETGPRALFSFSTVNSAAAICSSWVTRTSVNSGLW